MKSQFFPAGHSELLTTAYVSKLEIICFTLSVHNVFIHFYHTLLQTTNELHIHISLISNNQCKLRVIQMLQIQLLLDVSFLWQHLSQAQKTATGERGRSVVSHADFSSQTINEGPRDQKGEMD